METFGLDGITIQILSGRMINCDGDAFGDYKIWLPKPKQTH
jgi:hypothetical protein